VRVAAAQDRAATRCPRRCNCLVCALRRDLHPALRCRECGVWTEYDDTPGREAVTLCEDCESDRRQVTGGTAPRPW